MEDFQIYILQVNAGLVVFYLLYRMLFSRDTFFKNPAFISFFHRYTGFCISPDFVGILVGAR